jgi:hypothetical protein
MQRSRLWMAGCVVALLLGFPRTGSAGLWDFIVEMSGPRMYGISGDCRLLLDGTWDSCKVTVPATLQEFAVKERPNTRWWIAFGAGYYFSVAKTINGHDFDYFDVNMLTVEPMLEIQSRTSQVDYSNVRLQVYHGVLGLSYNLIFVKGDPPTFSNAAFKFRPVGVVVPIGRTWGFDASYNLRLYPSGFTAEDFGVGPSSPDDGGWEVVNGFEFGIRWKLGP